MAASATRNVGNNLQISKSFKIFPGAPSPRVARSPRLLQSTSRLPPCLPVAPSPSECFGMLPVPQPPERGTRVFRHRAVAGGSSVPASSGRFGSTGPAGMAAGTATPSPQTQAAGDTPGQRPRTALGREMNGGIQALEKQAYSSPPPGPHGWEKAHLPCGGCSYHSGTRNLSSPGGAKPQTLPEVSPRAWQRPCSAGLACTAQLGGGHTRLPGQNASEQNSLLLKIMVRMSNSLLPSFVPNKQAAPWLSLTDLGSLGFEQSAALENSAFALSQHPARAQECVYWP